MSKLDCSTSNNYLQLFRYYQLLQLEVNEFRTVAKRTKEFIQILDTKYGVTLMPNSKEISDLKERYLKLSERKLEQQLWDLRKYLNAGNLRHVVYTLYTEEGLTAREFGTKINHTEKAIIGLTSEGLVTYDLLDAICEYFGIVKTPEFTRYIKYTQKMGEGVATLDS